MRYFLRGAVPPGRNILLVESGSRSIVEKVLPRLRGAFGEEVRVDVVTCFRGVPAGLDPDDCARFAVQDYPGWRRRWELLRLLRRRSVSILGVVCSGEVILAQTKWMLVLGLPAKVLLINENADFFWLDWRHAGPAARLLRDRLGLRDEGFLRPLARAVLLPFGALFLLGYAAWMHVRRGLRLAWRRL